MLGLVLQNLNNFPTGSESSKTEMEWTSLSRFNHPPSLQLHADKKFEKDSEGIWVWYKNQVLPTFKIHLLPGFNSIKLRSSDSTIRRDLCHYVTIKCFAIFSGTEIQDIKLEGNHIVKFSKGKVADMRSIRLTETIKSLNCKCFVLCLFAFEAEEGKQLDTLIQLEDLISKKAPDDEFRKIISQNTLVSQYLSVQTRKKSLHQRVSLLCQLHPFVPNEFNRLLQMLHGDNPEEILGADIRGLYFYFSNKKIRHKIFHPFYLAARFHKSIRLFYLNDDAEEETNPQNLLDIFLKVQTSVEQALLLDTVADEENLPNNKNGRNIQPQLILQVISNRYTENHSAGQSSRPSKSASLENFRTKVINYLMPLQSSAIRIADETEEITTQYKRIDYNESVYQEAYTRVFPKILNTLFEYQEKRSNYPEYLQSVSYSAQKEELNEFNNKEILSTFKDKNKVIIKYQSVLAHKYEEKLKQKLKRVLVPSPILTQESVLKITDCNLNFGLQQQHEQRESLLFKENKEPSQESIIAATNKEQQLSEAARNALIAINKYCANGNETNRQSYNSNSSETVGINQAVPCSLKQNNQLPSQQSLQQQQQLQRIREELDEGEETNLEENHTSRNVQEDVCEFASAGHNKIKIRKIDRSSIGIKTSSSNQKSSSEQLLSKNQQGTQQLLIQNQQKQEQPQLISDFQLGQLASQTVGMSLQQILSQQQQKFPQQQQLQQQYQQLQQLQQSQQQQQQIQQLLLSQQQLKQQQQQQQQQFLQFPQTPYSQQQSQLPYFQGLIPPNSSSMNPVQNSLSNINSSSNNFNNLNGLLLNEVSRVLQGSPAMNMSLLQQQIHLQQSQQIQQPQLARQMNSTNDQLLGLLSMAAASSSSSQQQQQNPNLFFQQPQQSSSNSFNGQLHPNSSLDYQSLRMQNFK